MQLRVIGIGITNFGDFLQPRDRLPFFDQYLSSMCVGRQIIGRMPDDDQFSISTQTGTGINHFAGSRGTNWFTRLGSDVDTLAAPLAEWHRNRA